eukprot:scaffold241074_cov18-Tisochrysis_lutea.AAC.1
MFWGFRVAGAGVQKIIPWTSSLVGEVASSHHRATTAPFGVATLVPRQIILNSLKSQHVPSRSILKDPALEALTCNCEFSNFI